MVKNCAVETGKREIWQKYQKSTHFSSRVAWVNRSYFVGRQMLRFLDPQFISNHKKCLQGRGDAIFGWLVCSLSGISWYGWFVGGLYVVWLVCGWFRVIQLMEVFLGKSVLKVCSKFTGENPCWSLISTFTCRFAAYFQKTFSLEHL